MNVIPPYGRIALISSVTSMDDSEKEFTSITSVDGTAKSEGKIHVSGKAFKSCCFTNSAIYSALDPNQNQLNDAILLYILIAQRWLQRALLSHAHLQSVFTIGAIVRRQQELLGVHRFPTLINITSIRIQFVVQYRICLGVTFGLLSKGQSCKGLEKAFVDAVWTFCSNRGHPFSQQGLMLDAGMLLASSRILIFGGLVIALGLTGKSLSAVK